jgi:hypothetical protein
VYTVAARKPSAAATTNTHGLTWCYRKHVEQRRMLHFELYCEVLRVSILPFHCSICIVLSGEQYIKHQHRVGSLDMGYILLELQQLPSRLLMAGASIPILGL